MENKIREQMEQKVNGMVVAEMRKEAAAHGIKNAKQYKRPELAAKLIEVLVVEELAKAAEKASKAAKRAKKSKSTTKSEDKRYKAADLDATKEELQKMAEEVITGVTNQSITIEDLFQINRKVLIVVMKVLKCEKWYRTYDKPTMVNKIGAAVHTAA